MNRRSMILAAASVVGARAIFYQSGAFTSSSIDRGVTIRIVRDNLALISLDAEDTVDKDAPTVGDEGEAGPFTVPLTLEVGNQINHEMAFKLTITNPGEFDDPECNFQVMDCEFTLESGNLAEIDLTLKDNVEGVKTVTLGIEAVATDTEVVRMQASRRIALKRKEKALQGCSPGSWRSAQRNGWWGTATEGLDVGGYYTDDLVGDVFPSDKWKAVGGQGNGGPPGEGNNEADTGDLAAKELGEAVRDLSGGPDLAHAQNQLAGHATAALLNAAHPDINYALTEDEVIQQVQDALDTENRGEILDQKDKFDAYNNEGCPLNANGEVENNEEN